MPLETAPILTVGNRPLQPTLLQVEEPPGRIPSLYAEGRGGEIEPGQAVNLTLPDGSVFSGQIADAEDLNDDAGRMNWTLRAFPPARILEQEPACAVYHKITRSELHKRLLAPGGVSVTDGGRPDVEHPRAAFLSSEPRRNAAARLALLGGRVLLFPIGGALAVDPGRPQAERPVPPNTDFRARRRRRSLPSLKLIARDPKAWGKCIVHKFDSPQRGTSRHALLRFPEAVSQEELAAAGQAILNSERSGQMHIDGGPALAVFGPGTWLVLPGRPASLVTGRTRHWTPSSGWEVSLQFGYPWEEIGVPDRLTIHVCVVMAYDDTTGFLRLRLPEQDDLIVDAWLRAERATESELHLHLPAVGDAGTLLHDGGSDGLYLGSTTPLQRISRQQFDQDISLIQSAKLNYRLDKEGALELMLNRVEMTMKEKWHVRAADVDIDRYQG